MNQQFDKFPSADYEMLEQISQADSFINYRAFNKYDGCFVILKYVFLTKSSAQTQNFFSFMESLSSSNSDLFLQNYNIYYDDTIEDQKSSPDNLTLVLIMQNNVATLKDLVEERRKKFQSYSEPELINMMLRWVQGFQNVKDNELLSKATFHLENYMLVPNVVMPDLDNGIIEVQTTYSYKISNFDSFTGPSIDPSEKNIVKSMSSMVLQIMGKDSLDPENFINFPNLEKVLGSMANDNMELEDLRFCLEGIDRVPVSEDLFLPLTPVLPDLTEIERVKNFEVLSETYSNLGFYASAYNPAYSNFLYYQEQGKKSGEFAKSMNDLGVIQWRLEKFGEAKEILIRCMNLLKELYGMNHIALAVCYNNLGLVYEDLKDFNEALKYFELSYEMKLALENYERLPFIMNNLANLYDKTGLDEEKAKNFYENSLEVKENFGGKPASLAISLNNLAVFHSNRGNFDKAYEYQEKESKLSMNLSDENYLISLNNLAYISTQKGLVNDALNLYASALIILAKQGRSKTSLSATILSNYAALLFQINNFQKSAIIEEKALELKRELFGYNHMSYALSANNLGESYMRLERYDDAIRFLEESLKFRVQVVNPNDPKLIAPLNNLGMAYVKIKNLEKAREYIFKALAIDENDVTSLNNVALMFSLEDNNDYAVHHYGLALDRLREINGEYNEEYMKIANNKAAVYVKIKDYENAELFLRKSLNICEETFPEKVDFIVKTKERLEHLIRVKEKNVKSFL